MTKREICERLLKIHNALEDIEPPIGDVFHEVEELLLDLAAPDDHFADAGKMMREEEKSPLAMKWVAVDKSAPLKPCPKCGAPSPKRIDAPGYYCEPCGAGFEAEEKHPGVLAKPGKDGEIEFCWCQKCYEQAAVVHDPFGDGENWSYCKKCGVSFRLKRGEGEK